MPVHRNCDECGNAEVMVCPECDRYLCKSCYGTDSGACYGCMQGTSPPIGGWRVGGEDDHE